MRALIKELQLNSSEEAKVTNHILDGDWQALGEVQTTNPEIHSLLSQVMNLKGKSSNFLQNIRALSQQASSYFKVALDDFTNVTTLLDNLGCDYEVDFTAMQNFEYYTGACFQLLSGGQRISGGGRYDDLIPLMGGKDIPACGFALYVDTIMKLLPPGNGNDVQILVKGEEPTAEVVRTCFTLAQSLRDAGHATELGFVGQEITDYRWVISVSTKKPFVLKDCRQGRQQDVTSTVEILDVIGK